MPLPLFVSCSCPALLFVPLADSDRVTLRYSVLASLVLTTPLSSAKFTDSEHILFWLFFNILSETFSIYRYVFYAVAVLRKIVRYRIFDQIILT